MEGATWKTCRREDERPAHRARTPKPSTAQAPPEPIPKNPEPETDWTAEARRCADRLTDRDRRILAKRLGVPLDAQAAIPLLGVRSRAFGSRGEIIEYTFPECDGAGRIIGLATRAEFGRGSKAEKKAVGGGLRGLVLPSGWREAAEREKVLYVVEGPTDVLAMTAAGLPCIGRPSNSGGLDHLEDLFETMPGVVPVIVGENDRKPNGEHPGAACVTLARDLRGRLFGRSVRYTFPPVVKDVRDWLTAGERGATTWAERGEELCRLLDAAALPKPTAKPPQVESETGVEAGSAMCARILGGEPSSPASSLSSFKIRAHISPATGWRAILARLKGMKVFCLDGRKRPMEGNHPKTFGEVCGFRCRCNVRRCPACHVMIRHERVEELCPRIAAHAGTVAVWSGDEKGQRLLLLRLRRRAAKLKSKTKGTGKRKCWWSVSIQPVQHGPITVVVTTEAKLLTRRDGPGVIPAEGAADLVAELVDKLSTKSGTRGDRFYPFTFANYERKKPVKYYTVLRESTGVPVVPVVWGRRAATALEEAGYTDVVGEDATPLDARSKKDFSGRDGNRALAIDKLTGRVPILAPPPGSAHSSPALTPTKRITLADLDDAFEAAGVRP